MNLRVCIYKLDITGSKLSVTVAPIVLAFLGSYMVESKFNHVHYLLSKTEKHFDHRTC